MDLLTILEEAYRLEGAEDTWLAGLLEATAPQMLSSPHRAYAMTYDARDPTQLRFGTIVTRNFPPGRGRQEIVASHAALAAADVERSFGRVACATASQMFGADARNKVGIAPWEAFDVRDTLGVNALDPTGQGCVLVGLLTEPRTVDPATAETWAKIAAHIAAARRLRATLTGRNDDPAKWPSAEAILSPSGALEHAQGDEAHGARETLVQAVQAMERARGTDRRKPEVALEGWKAMVHARWSLVEHFERDGKRYLVAVRNEALPPLPPEALAALTLRERQVVGFRLLGHTNKVAAYELGISGSTYRVLLARALKKLGLPSAAALMQLVAQRSEDAARG